jgi:hypothetical protein
MKSVSDRAYREVQSTHFRPNFFFKKKLYSWTATDDNIIGRIRFECWIIKATNTHSEYIIPTVFPLQQWLYERASILRNTHIARLAYRMI